MLCMATETATIRVTRETRDLLAQQAGVRGVSLSAMLADLAHGVAREGIFRAERDATRGGRWRHRCEGRGARLGDNPR